MTVRFTITTRLTTLLITSSTPSGVPQETARFSTAPLSNWARLSMARHITEGPRVQELFLIMI